MSVSNQSDHPSTIEPVIWKKQLNLLNGVTLNIGTMIGSGIFVSPKGVLRRAGSVGVSLIVWLLCGVINLIGGTCFAELGTSILESGGEFAYLRRAYGDLLAFLYLWTSLGIVAPCGNAITSLVFANYVLKPVFPDCNIPTHVVTLLAVFVTVLVTVINCINVKLVLRVQDVFSFTKVFAIGVVIVAGAVHLGRGYTEHLRLENAFENSGSDVGSVALAFYSGMFAYTGSTSLNYVTEELKNPEKNLPRAIFISISLVTLVYFLANVAYFAVLSTNDILESSAVAVTFADRILGVMNWLVPLFVALSTLGGLNGSVFSVARIIVVAARHDMLPGILGMLSYRYLTPVTALLFHALTTIIAICVSDVYTLINYAVFVEALFNVITVSSILYWRWKLQDLKRPFKPCLAFPIVFLIICTLMLVAPLTYSPRDSLVGICIMLVGIPVYLVCVKWERKAKFFAKWMKALTIFLQKLLLCVKEEAEFE